MVGESKAAWSEVSVVNYAYANEVESYYAKREVRKDLPLDLTNLTMFHQINCS